MRHVTRGQKRGFEQAENDRRDTLDERVALRSYDTMPAGTPQSFGEPGGITYSTSGENETVSIFPCRYPSEQRYMQFMERPLEPGMLVFVSSKRPSHSNPLIALRSKFSLRAGLQEDAIYAEHSMVANHSCRVDYRAALQHIKSSAAAQTCIPTMHALAQLSDPAIILNGFGSSNDHLLAVFRTLRDTNIVADYLASRQLGEETASKRIEKIYGVPDLHKFYQDSLLFLNHVTVSKMWNFAGAVLTSVEPAQLRDGSIAPPSLMLGSHTYEPDNKRRRQAVPLVIFGKAQITDVTPHITSDWAKIAIYAVQVEDEPPFLFATDAHMPVLPLPERFRKLNGNRHLGETDQYDGMQHENPQNHIFAETFDGFLRFRERDDKGNVKANGNVARLRYGYTRLDAHIIKKKIQGIRKVKSDAKASIVEVMALQGVAPLDWTDSAGGARSVAPATAAIFTDAAWADRKTEEKILGEAFVRSAKQPFVMASIRQ